MLLELENNNKADIDKLLAFAKANALKLSVIDDSSINSFLPGAPLSATTLEGLIQKSRLSGTISLNDAHQIIRNNYHAD
ncbi:MAG: hypothetical protein RL115_2237 [Bacteroidota bacterium]|jgi:hypothetical protein